MRELLRLSDYVDMIIPRGGNALHTFCRENSTIPVITGGIGICHLYVDETADLAAAVKIVQNAKVQRPSVCNALDTLLVQESIAGAVYAPGDGPADTGSRAVSSRRAGASATPQGAITSNWRVRAIGIPNGWI